MKILKILFIATLTTILLGSCENEPAVFEAGMEIVGFDTDQGSIYEAPGAPLSNTIEIPVYIATTTTQSITVTFGVDTASSTAVEGLDFELVGGTTLTFPNGGGYDTIVVRAIDNGIFEGDKSCVIALKTNSADYAFSAENSFTVKIVDDEHPLKVILGTYNVLASSYFGSNNSYQFSISADASDLTKIWINNFVGGGSNLDVYGTVVKEDDGTGVISVPVGQAIVDTRGTLEGFYGPDGATGIPTGGHITITFDADGSLVILDEYGAQVISSGNWYNIYMSGATASK